MDNEWSPAKRDHNESGQSLLLCRLKEKTFLERGWLVWKYSALKLKGGPLGQRHQLKLHYANIRQGDRHNEKVIASVKVNLTGKDILSE